MLQMLMVRRIEGRNGGDRLGGAGQVHGFSSTLLQGDEQFTNYLLFSNISLTHSSGKAVTMEPMFRACWHLSLMNSFVLRNLEHIPVVT